MFSQANAAVWGWGCGRQRGAGLRAPGTRFTDNSHSRPAGGPSRPGGSRAGLCDVLSPAPASAGSVTAPVPLCGGRTRSPEREWLPGHTARGGQADGKLGCLRATHRGAAEALMPVCATPASPISPLCTVVSSSFLEGPYLWKVPQLSLAAHLESAQHAPRGRPHPERGSLPQWGRAGGQGAAHSWAVTSSWEPAEGQARPAHWGLSNWG